MAYTNETVTLTVKPNDGYELQSITVVTADETSDLLPLQPRGKAVELIQGDDGIYTFKMPAGAVTVRANFVVCYEGPQVLYCEDNTTLYFVKPGYTVKVGDLWSGHKVTQVWREEILDNAYNTPGWNRYRAEVTMVDIAPEFATVRPKSCFGWFYQFAKAQFRGLEYLNTSDVTAMNAMFSGCNAITTIDVNTFDVSNVVNATSMFHGCENLTTIY